MADPVIHAAMCRKCGKLSYPTHFYCPACGTTEFESVPIQGEGKLLTWTRCYNLSLDYDDLFIGLGIVEMDMGIRALGQLRIADPCRGMRVRATVGPVRDVNGRDVFGLIFESAEVLAEP